ncbi:MAG: hypothetical protein LQ340_007005 [Diploschistes diacapsis]|nr:MAG: hypothetical protein LQ340_007005 [Diploschistes diacapsis]
MLQDLCVSPRLLPPPHPHQTPIPNPNQSNLPLSTRHSVNQQVIVRLKWGQTEYKGRLVSVDSYMNVQLSGTEEFIDLKSTGSLGQVLIRCNNVLWISAAKDSKGEDVKMEE